MKFDPPDLLFKISSPKSDEMIRLQILVRVVTPLISIMKTGTLDRYVKNGG
jgi:hypothetical protein